MTPSRLCLLLWLLCLAPAAWGADPRAQQGTLDLRGHPLGRAPVSLRGEWAFAWSETPQDRRLVQVPGAWESLEKRWLWQPAWGSGEYRLRVLLHPQDQGQVLQLHTPFVSSRFRCFVGEQPVGQSGVTLAGPPQRTRLNYFAPFVAQGSEVLLRCRVDNLSFQRSGLLEPIWLGHAAEIQTRRLRRESALAFVLGLLFLLMLYHLILFALRPRNRLALWFGLHSLFGLLYLDLLQSHLLEQGLGGLDFDLSLSLLRACLILAALTFCRYLGHLFPEVYPRRLAHLVHVGLWVLLVATLTLPAVVVAPSIVIFWGLQFLQQGLWCWTALAAVRAHRPGAHLFLAGILLFFASAINDSLVVAGRLSTGYVLGLGFQLLALSQTLILARRFNQAFDDSEQLAQALQQANEHLEQRVAERTEALLLQNEQVARLGAFKERLTQMIIHDLKNPLWLILAQRGPDAQAWARVRSAATQMQQLVLNMLDVTRAREAQLPLQLTEQDLGALVQQACAEMRYSADQRQLVLQAEIPAGIFVRVDREIVRRVLVNLLNNAIRHAELGSAVAITAQLESDRVSLWVLNRGPQIPEHQLAQLFQPFASFSGVQDASSTGLGLAFCQLALQAHQGTLALENRAEGVCAWFSLPLLADASVSVPAPADAPQSERLSPDDWRALKPLREQLQHCEVYDISAIRAALRLFPAAPSQALRHWHRALIQACDRFDETAFAKLLEPDPEHMVG
ncbi:MAG: ATP-binding protein [Candidatus Sericytochromatia bacterium]